MVAAGSGQRMGAGRNKVLLEILGEPILLHTLRHLLDSAAIDELIVVARDDDAAEFRSIFTRDPRLSGVHLAPGGPERDDSVGNGLLAVSESVETILIHDAARPFVSRRLVASLLLALERENAAIPAVPLNDTVKRVEEHAIVETIDRSTLFGAQTPQAFRAHDLRAARAMPRGGARPTDDAALYERLGRRVAIVAGDPWNVKLTTRDDLALAPALLASFRAREHRAAELP